MNHIFKGIVAALLFCVLAPAVTQGAEASSISIVTVSPAQMGVSYTNLTPNTDIVMVELNTGTRTVVGKAKKSSGTVSLKVPKKSYSTMYWLEGQGVSGTVQTSTFQAGGRVQDAPTCTIEASAHQVLINEKFTLSWTSKKAVAPAVGLIGFPNDTEFSTRGKESFKSSLPGLRTYVLVFQAASGNQVTCAAYVNVIGANPIGTFDAESLETNSSRPTITGTAVGVRKVKLFVSGSVGKDEWFYSSRPLTVRNGVWSHRLLKALPSDMDQFRVELLGYDNGQYLTLASDTLSVE